MAALSIDLTIPLGDGSISFAADIPDLSQLRPEHRQALAETTEDFLKFAAGTIAPPATAVPQERQALTDAEVKRDRGALAGIDGGRAGGRA